MRLNICKPIIVFLLFIPWRILGQTGTNPPLPPVLKLVTVELSSGRPVLGWTKSPSAHVSGYVLYYFTNGEGHAFDTIHNPNITTYIDMNSLPQYFVESYVIAAIDTAGNISPLSNELHTILPRITADSCRGIINLSWNSYAPVPSGVTGYTVMVSENGGAYLEAGQTKASETSYTVTSIKALVNYCFLIIANLEGGLVSNSSINCRTVQMERTPAWMNADYATVTSDSTILLSFTIDPLSGISRFRIRRKRLSDNDTVSFSGIRQVNNSIAYNDITARPAERYTYQLLAINRCGLASDTSNEAGNIVLDLNTENEIIKLNWNRYNFWNGGVGSYRIFMNAGTGFTQVNVISPFDSSYILDYHNIMYDVSVEKICFYVEASENTNRYNITGVSRSNSVCTGILERITVPNAFTPDNDNLNDLFRPILSFTPTDYHLIITDRQNNKLFEATDPLQAWNGTKGGSVLPPDVYLWYLRVKAPSGKLVSRTGTVAIVRTQ